MGAAERAESLATAGSERLKAVGLLGVPAVIASRLGGRCRRRDFVKRNEACSSEGFFPVGVADDGDLVIVAEGLRLFHFLAAEIKFA